MMAGFPTIAAAASQRSGELQPAAPLGVTGPPLERGEQIRD